MESSNIKLLELGLRKLGFSSEADILIATAEKNSSQLHPFLKMLIDSPEIQENRDAAQLLFIAVSVPDVHRLQSFVDSI